MAAVPSTPSCVTGSTEDGTKCISLPFLGLVDKPYKVAKLWGLYRLSNKILGSLRPYDPLKAPKEA